jgi:hypothetical protein
MDGWPDRWNDGWLYGLMDGLLDGNRIGCMNRRVVVSWMDERMD